MAGRNKTVRFHLIQAHSWDWNLRTSVWQVLERYVCGWSIITSVRVFMWLNTWKTVTECYFRCCVIEWYVCMCLLTYICKIWTFEVCSYFNVYCKRYCIHPWLLYTVKSVERGEQKYSYHFVVIVATCSECDYRPITRFLQSHYLLLDSTFCDHINDVAVRLPLALINLFAQTFEQVSFVQCEKRQSTVRGIWMTLL